MASYRFALQRARFIGPIDHVPGELWEQVSRHTTARGADMALARIYSNFVVASQGYGTHYRVVALQDTEIALELECDGTGVFSDAPYHPCDATYSGTVLWRAGMSETDMLHQIGWAQYDQCEPCAAEEREYTDREQ